MLASYQAACRSTVDRDEAWLHIAAILIAASCLLLYR